jgi:hypothetical protein
MSGGRRNWSGKSTSSLEEIPEAHVAKLKRQLQEREKKKSQGEVPRHDVPREPPLSPSSRARAEEERIHKLYPIVIIFLLFFHYFIITNLYFNFILVTGLFS